MPTVLIDIGLKILMQLVSYKFVCRMLILGADAWSKSTKNTLDDEVVAALTEALK